jgi:5-oxoprolinase (ATP-hydrolysing) subunit C
MSRLVVDSAGPVTSVQDSGRHGVQRYGMPPSGAMDLLSLAIANTLVGSTPDSAAIEIGPLAATFTAEDGAVRLALGGAQRAVAIDERPVAINQSFTLKPGQTLSLGVARSGVFSYLALQGGIGGERVFGSLAVNARAGLGGPYPRPLRAGDAVVAQDATPAPDWRIDLPAAPDAPIRIVLGPQHDEFSNEAVALLLDSEWRVSATSDRMGYRLEGPAIPHAHGHNIVSDGTVNGSIQIPGSGKPLVLMPDRGTSGGYPKIATVISADLGRLAQTQPGRRFRLGAVSVAEAQAEYRAFASLIRALPSYLVDARYATLDLDALLDANVAGAAANAFDTD